MWTDIDPLLCCL